MAAEAEALRELEGSRWRGADARWGGNGSAKRLSTAGGGVTNGKRAAALDAHAAQVWRSSSLREPCHFMIRVIADCHVAVQLNQFIPVFL